MDNTDKNLTLIEELIQHTRNGSLAWKKTADGDSYMVSLPDYAIRISGPSRYIPILDPRLRVFDSSGNVRREIRTNMDLKDVQRQPLGVVGMTMVVPYEYSQRYAEPLKTLYELASEDAEKGSGDRFVDDLLSQLHQLSGEGAKHS